MKNSPSRQHKHKEDNQNTIKDMEGSFNPLKRHIISLNIVKGKLKTQCTPYTFIKKAIMKYINKTRHVDKLKTALDLILSITQSAVVSTSNDNTQQVVAEMEVSGQFSLCNKLKGTQ